MKTAGCAKAVMTRSLFLNPQTVQRLKQLTQYPIYTPFPCSSPTIVLPGWYFPRHTSKLPWSNSPGHCLTSCIYPGTILYLNRRSDTSIFPSRMWTDLHLWRTVEKPSREGLVSSSVCSPSELGPNK